LPPTYTTVDDLPDPSESQLQLRVIATGVHHLVRSRAAGRHYTSKSLPHLPGVDGVGVHVKTGRRYYFSAFTTGSFAELVNVEKQRAWPLPEIDGADPVAIAAYMNPAMSSWMAFATRTSALKTGFSVAILGATSTSGRIAVDVARAHGAGHVVGIARNAAAMGHKHLDASIELNSSTDWNRLGKIDVILDYVYGEPSLDLLRALPPTDQEIQFVHLGSMSGQTEINLPGSILRSKRVALRGAGPGSWTMEEFAAEVPALLQLVAGLEKGHDVVTKSLEEVENVWADPSFITKRIVFMSKTE
jgi:NADPH:quinone reductase-like Zn-dependent oxidoreductase